MTTSFATEREIRQQPAVWRSFAPKLAARADELGKWLETRKHDEIWFCGAGTSAFIGDALVVALNARPGPAVFRAVASTDLVASPQNFLREDRKVLVVSFGRSGNSSESVGTLDLLDSHAPGYDRLHITCNGESTLATRPMPEGASGETQTIILPDETHDSAFAMTSSYTTMLLSALSVFSRPAEGVETRLGRLAKIAQSVIEESFSADTPLVERVVFLGSGALAGAAREAALKVLELTAGQVTTMFDSPLGFRHGPKAVVNEKTRVHVFRSAHPHTEKYERDLVAELGQQFSPDIVTETGPYLESGEDAWSIPLHVIPAQVMALRWSEWLGLQPDDPFAGRNLTRVVSGVTVYPFDLAWSDASGQAIGFGGIDLGGTKVEARLYDNDMREVMRKRVPTPKGDYPALVRTVVELVHWLREEGRAGLPVGIGVPGIVDPETGQSKTANLPATGLPITAEIKARTGGEIYFANDCKLFALSEAIGGAGEEARTIFGLIIGTGLGGGVVHNKILFTGKEGLPGEVGHFAIPATLELPPIKCGCGAVGCYETYLSGEGIARIAKLKSGQSVSAREVFERAEAGDEAMLEVTDLWFALLAELLLTLNLCIDPDMVVIGGGVCEAPGLVERAQKAINARVLTGTRAPTIAKARFGDASGARGAALFAATKFRK